MITNLEQTEGTEIAVVTVPETTPADSPKAFATQLFNYWGIGKAEINNGVLFLISTGDRRVEIETGYGIESILTDAQVGKIIDTKITPQYKQGNFDRGTLDGTSALISALNPVTSIQDSSELTFRIIDQTKASSSVIKTSSFGVALFVFLIVWFIFMVIASNGGSGGNGGNGGSGGSGGRKGKSRKRSSYSGSSYGGYSGSSSSSSSSSSYGGYSGGGGATDGGSSGGGFGGGASDGGGAGGDW